MPNRTMYKTQDTPSLKIPNKVYIHSKMPSSSWGIGHLEQWVRVMPDFGIRHASLVVVVVEGLVGVVDRTLVAKLEPVGVVGLEFAEASEPVELELVAGTLDLVAGTLERVEVRELVEQS